MHTVILKTLQTRATRVVSGAHYDVTILGGVIISSLKFVKFDWKNTIWPNQFENTIWPNHATSGTTSIDYKGWREGSESP